MPASKKPDEFLTVTQVAKRLKLPAKAVHAVIASGRLRCVRVGTGRGAVRIRERDLDAYLLASEVKPQPPARPQTDDTPHAVVDQPKPKPSKPPFVSSGGVELTINADGTVTRTTFGGFCQRPMTDEEFLPWFELIRERVEAKKAAKRDTKAKPEAAVGRRPMSKRKK